MTLPSDLPPEFSHSGVRPADRLGFTLFLAALIHLALILGVGFTMVEPRQITKTLEITLATFKSEKKPEKADFLAQDNQQGSGTLDKKAIPKTTEVAPFQDNKVNKVTPPPVPKPGNIVCMAVNYMEDGTLPEKPAINAFHKAATAVIGDGETMVLPDAPATIFEGEGEMALVIGKRATRVAPADAFKHIFGYTCFIDGSARGLPPPLAMV